MSDETRMTLLHSSTNDLVEELLMWRGRAAELLDRIAKLEEKLAELIEVGNKMRDVTEQNIGGYIDETIDWRGMAEEAHDVLQEREE